MELAVPNTELKNNTYEQTSVFNQIKTLDALQST